MVKAQDRPGTEVLRGCCMASAVPSSGQGCVQESCALLLLLQEARDQGLEYCGWDVGHVPQCHYSDAKHAEAYGGSGGGDAERLITPGVRHGAACGWPA
jgi:hypothetical protein